MSRATGGRPGRGAWPGVVIGLGATVVMDLTAAVLRQAWGVQPLDYRLVGRWLMHMRRGTFFHDSILDADVAPGELSLGWATHYAIGASIASVLTALRPSWVQRPTPAPALLAGLASAAAPLLVMQPAFGMGVAASSSPHPSAIRLGVLRTHLVYGVGLYATARLLASTLRRSQ